ncbi:MAG: hypothetical protein RSB41_02680 [Bacilli bacterium]
MRDKKEEFYDIYNEFYNVEKYKKLSNEVHHGVSRLDHIGRVAKLSFSVSKHLHMDYVSATRGAFMHDFFTLEDFNKTGEKSSFKTHPSLALKNAKKYFNTNSVEEDVVLKHMYPVTKERPKYKESYLVSIVDKVVSLYEVVHFKLKLNLSIAVIFLFNNLK